MADNILESYLVKLGAVTDANSFNKFNSTLKDSGKIFGDFSLSTIANFGKMEVAIVGMFGAVGAGLIGLADKTAMADQSYQMMGMRMLMGKDSAKALSQALDEVGVSMDEAAFNPEANRRVQALYEKNIELGKSLGKSFDGNMVGVRNMRMEFERFGVELDTLQAGVVSKLFEKLDLGSGKSLNQLDKLNDWFSDNIPKWSDSVATHLVPVWNDFKITTKDTGSSLRTAGGDFTYLSGILLGDKSIQSTTFNVNNLMTALDDWADKLTNVSLKFQLLGRIGMHAVTGVAAALAGAHAQATDSKAAEPFKKQVEKDSDAIIHDLHGLLDSKFRTGEDFAGLRAHADEVRNRNAKKAPPLEARTYPDTQTDFSADASPYGKETVSHQSQATASTAAKLAQKVSVDTGIPADLIFGEWMFETGKFTNTGAKELNNLSGIRIPGTDKYKSYESLDTFAAAYERLLESPRYVSQGIMTARTPEAFAHDLKGGSYYEGPEADYAAGIRKYQPSFRDYAQSGSKGTGDVTVNIQAINVPPGTHPDDIKRYITDSMIEFKGKVDRNSAAQTGSAGSYY